MMCETCKAQGRPEGSRCPSEMSDAEVRAEHARNKRNAAQRRARAARKAVYDSLGMVRVKGALGGTYYE